MSQYGNTHSAAAEDGGKEIQEISPQTSQSADLSTGKFTDGPNSSRSAKQIVLSLLAQLETAAQQGVLDLAVELTERLFTEHSEFRAVGARGACCTAEALLRTDTPTNIDRARELCSRINLSDPNLPSQHKIWALLLKACADHLTHGYESTYEALSTFQTLLKSARESDFDQIYGAIRLALEATTATGAHQLDKAITDITINSMERHRNKKMYGSFYAYLLTKGAWLDIALHVPSDSLQKIASLSEFLEEFALDKHDQEIMIRRDISNIYKALGYYVHARQHLTQAIELTNEEPVSLARLHMLLELVTIDEALEQPERAQRSRHELKRRCFELLPRELRRAVNEGSTIPIPENTEAPGVDIAPIMALLGEVFIREFGRATNSDPEHPEIPMILSKLRSIDSFLQASQSSHSISCRVVIAHALAAVPGENKLHEGQIETLLQLAQDPELDPLTRVQAELLAAIHLFKSGETDASMTRYSQAMELFDESTGNLQTAEMLTLLTLQCVFLNLSEDWNELKEALHRKIDLREHLGLMNCPGGRRDQELMDTLNGEQE